jgi:hypothetical protein
LREIGGAIDSGCVKEARSWVLAATILASSMALFDGTVVNVALPALQASSTQQWWICSGWLSLREFFWLL